MYIDSAGLLEPGHYKPSPHCDPRPAKAEINLIVIHGISLPAGQFGQNLVEPFFCGQLDTSLHPSLAELAELRVSAHLFINRQGEVTQFVPFSQRAWHAGVSQFQGQSDCNDFSIGIELEGTDELPYEEAQYQQLATLIILLRQHYPAISAERVVGHSEVAPRRKTDPGKSFDWTYLRTLI